KTLGKSPLPMSTEFEVARFSALMRNARTVDGFADKRILVIGDLMLDEYIWGKVSRISPEAPVPVVNVTGETYYPGGAANVARNLRELGAQTSLLGLVGADSYGDRLCKLLDEVGLHNTAGILCDPGRPTTVKSRIIA